MTHIGHGEKVLFMRVFIAVLVLIFSFQSFTKADDIRDFEIEGMSIGDSLLDHFSEKKIRDNVFKTSYKSKKYTKIEFFNNANPSKIYDGLQFFVKKNDKKFKIYALSANLLYTYNIEECFIKQDEIVEEISPLFKKAKIERKVLTHSADKSGKSKVHTYRFRYSSGANGGVDCNDYSKKILKKYGWEDNLRVYVMSSEFSKWLNTEAY